MCFSPQHNLVDPTYSKGDQLRSFSHKLPIAKLSLPDFMLAKVLFCFLFSSFNTNTIIYYFS